MPNLSAGGTEKVMSFLAQNLNKNYFTVKLVIIGYDKDTVYDTSGVETIYLNKSHVRSAFFILLKIIKKEKPELVFSSLSHLNTLMGVIAFLFPKSIFIGRETIVSRAQDNFATKGFNFRVVRTISKIAYGGLEVLISQSEDMKNDLISYRGFRPEKIVTINNPISDNFEIKKTIPAFKGVYQFVTVGRLTKKKGHERILKCLSKIDVPFIYTIIGDGPEKENIINLTNTLNLTNCINHISFTNEVNRYLRESNVYLQGSYVEGFPNALLESLAVGTPAIVFNAPGGINEIIINEENGYIVKDKVEFQEKLNTVIDNLNNFNPEKVARHVRQNFSSSHILNEYENLFNKLIESKEKTN